MTPGAYEVTGGGWKLFEKIGDAESTVLAHDIAKQIEEDMQYPGQIKVLVIRESRAVDYAK